MYACTCVSMANMPLTQQPGVRNRFSRRPPTRPLPPRHHLTRCSRQPSPVTLAGAAASRRGGGGDGVVGGGRGRSGGGLAGLGVFEKREYGVFWCGRGPISSLPDGNTPRGLARVCCDRARTGVYLPCVSALCVQRR